MQGQTLSHCSGDTHSISLPLFSFSHFLSFSFSHFLSFFLSLFHSSLFLSFSLSLSFYLSSSLLSFSLSLFLSFSLTPFLSFSLKSHSSMIGSCENIESWPVTTADLHFVSLLRTHCTSLTISLCPSFSLLFFLPLIL
jgi:hypothetical protein